MQILINLLILFLFSRYLNYIVFNKVLVACQQKMLCLHSLKQRTFTKAILEIVVLDNHSLLYCYWSSAIRCYLIFILAELPRGAPYLRKKGISIESIFHGLTQGSRAFARFLPGVRVPPQQTHNSL